MCASCDGPVVFPKGLTSKPVLVSDKGFGGAKAVAQERKRVMKFKTSWLNSGHVLFATQTNQMHIGPVTAPICIFKID